MSIRRLSMSLCPCVLFISLCGLGFAVHAEGFDSNPNYLGGSDEDTILVEDEVDFKISYSKAIKSVCKNLIGLDIDKYFSGGKNKRSAVIRQLDDLADRSYYRLRVDEDEIKFKFTLNL